MIVIETLNSRPLRTFWIALILFFCSLSGIFAADVYEIHDMVINLDEAREPFLWQEYIVFTFQQEKQPRVVSAAFDHEHFDRLHTFSRNENGVYFLLYPRTELQTLTYRIVVDGLWMPDPHSVQTVQGFNGVTLSRVNLPPLDEPQGQSPRLDGNRRVTFFIVDKKGRAVYLVGDFNRWDPYMTPMQETPLPDGVRSVYEMTITLPAGFHSYYFLVGGEKILDPLNHQIGVNVFGDRASTFNLP